MEGEAQMVLKGAEERRKEVRSEGRGDEGN